MDVTIDRIKSWFGITEEQIAEKLAAEKESQKQALRDRIANLASETQTHQAELAALETETVAEQAAETPAEEAAPQG